MGNIGSCGKKARRKAAAQANRRAGQAADPAFAGSNQYEQQLASSDLYGAAQSGYGGVSYGMECPQGIDQDIALLATAAALAVGIYVVYRQITLQTATRRKRSDDGEGLISRLQDIVYMGLEEFEDKVDKIASGQDDDSWIGQIYNTFSSNFGMDGSKVDDSELGPKEGLEPPILDETWGLEDVRKLHETDEEVPIEPRGSRSKRSDVDENNNENEIGDEPLVVKDDLMDSMMDSMFSGETKCKARFWKCLGMVAQSSLHYMNEPGGISSAVQKMMFRVAFHGGIGNFWKALMTIPEARQVKHCMNKQDDCMSFEVLRKEVQTLGPDGQEFVSGMDETPDQTINKRLLINPEFVESMDTSDGSQQFSPEDQLIEDEFAKQE